MRITPLCSAATASLLLAGLTACGGDSTPAADDPTPAETASSSTPAESEEPKESESESEESEGEASEAPEESAEPEGDPEESGGYDAQELLAAMKAAVAENETTHVTMELGQGGQSMTGEGDVSYAGDSTAMQMMMTAPGLGGGTIEMRLVDETMYMAIPPTTPPGKFIEFDTTDPNSPLGDLGGITGGDPLSTFDAFEAGLQKVRYVGEEDVDGEDMDHYVLSVDAKKAARAQGTPQTSGTPRTITYDLWLDDEDLMRRMQFSQAGAGMTVSMDDWGQPVSVAAPPPAAIMQMPGR
ncbi:MAG: LppX_LprAFG lipoprotein [Nocardioidaceae bacterium]|nr:LppX_LprAFG lipoprotein [Nocardioidaceae bacterium]